MKISSAVLGALLVVQASCAATVPRNDDYSQLEELLKQAGEVAKEELAAAESDPTKRTLGGSCTLQNLSIRREWSVASSPAALLLTLSAGAHYPRKTGKHTRLLATVLRQSRLVLRRQSLLAPSRGGM